MQKPMNRAIAPKIRSIVPAGLLLGFFSLAGLARLTWGEGGVVLRAVRPVCSTRRAVRSMVLSIWAMARSMAWSTDSPARSKARPICFSARSTLVSALRMARSTTLRAWSS